MNNGKNFLLGSFLLRGFKYKICNLSIILIILILLVGLISFFLTKMNIFETLNNTLIYILVVFLISTILFVFLNSFSKEKLKYLDNIIENSSIIFLFLIITSLLQLFSSYMIEYSYIIEYLNLGIFFYLIFSLIFNLSKNNDIRKTKVLASYFLTILIGFVIVIISQFGELFYQIT